MIKIEVLFPELCSLFADSSNIKYLQKCLPEAEFVFTAFTDEPLFATEAPSLIYMGAMSERTQEMVIKKLMPYKDRLKQLIEADVPMLFTNNAVEVLCQYIENEDKSRIKALGIYKFCAKRDMMHRFNCLVKGKFNGIDIVGFKSQFTLAYGHTDDYPFINVERGCGMNKKTMNEGIHDHNLFATYIIGPFLVLNPLFTKYFIQEVMGLKEAGLAFEPVVMEAYEKRLKEFSDPKCDFN